MKRFREYLARGKPLVAFRTASHGFSARDDLPAGCEDWKAFDREVLGCTYGGHSSGETRVTALPEAAGHPILEGLSGPYQVRETLYQSAPLASTCRALLRGRTVEGGKESGELEQPVAWTNTCRGARIFYTSLGSAEASFRETWFLGMVVRAAFWALDRPLPDGSLEGLGK
jgi:type 1 glutamine amidotransferase